MEKRTLNAGSTVFLESDKLSEITRKGLVQSGRRDVVVDTAIIDGLALGDEVFGYRQSAQWAVNSGIHAHDGVFLVFRNGKRTVQLNVTGESGRVRLEDVMRVASLIHERLGK
jgi:hypothetical protein